MPDGQSILPPLPISDMTTGIVGALAAMIAIRGRVAKGSLYHDFTSLVAADTITLEEDVGLYPPETVH